MCATTERANVSHNEWEEALRFVNLWWGREGEKRIQLERSVKKKQLSLHNAFAANVLMCECYKR